MREGAHMRVVVEGLAHRFPGTDLLFEHLDFVAEPGSTIAVCGPSGCGKSTLLSILAGWEKPYAGTVTREGVNRVGWVFQNPYGVAERTALDHVVFPLLAKGMRRKEAEPKALEAMGLFDLEYAADRRFSDLSGGEAQRLMLARAVCSKPDMLLVDEPTAQLDTRTAHSVSHVLNNLSGQGMIVLVATHDPDTRDACDRVLDLADYAPGGSKSQEPELEEATGHQSHEQRCQTRTTRRGLEPARRGNRHMRVRGSMRAAPARPRAGIARLGRGDDHRASQRAGILR